MRAGRTPTLGIDGQPIAVGSGGDFGASARSENRPHLLSPTSSAAEEAMVWLCCVGAEGFHLARLGRLGPEGN